mmetsp:Transcript_41657/g.53737  ORF Transcript_41657/g.53737 Transcript_41657/m.53737 type:complete len:149 (+) Transcript_41657:1576-2022(+)
MQKVEMAQKRLKDIRLLVEKWVESMPQVTESERADVIALVEKAETWLEEKVALQEDAPLHEPPFFTSTEVAQSLKATANLVTRLSRKPKPKPKAIINATNSTANSSFSNSTTNSDEKNQEEDGDETVEPVEPLSEEGDKAEANKKEEL